MSESMCANESDAREAIKNFVMAMERLEKPPHWESKFVNEFLSYKLLHQNAVIKMAKCSNHRLHLNRSWTISAWGFGMAMITATAFAAALAFMCVPFISKRVYDRLLNFLLALGVGNLTGCTLFVLFPRVSNFLIL
jgi:hypothetical protein